VSAALQRAWLRRGALARALWPLSLLYRLVALLHRQLYATGLRRVERLQAPVIVVGNVVAGGAGKTPVVMALVEHLQRRGLQVGVVSRGYGRSGDGCLEVQPQDDPSRTGDEPLLVRRRTGAPVFVARRRADAGRALLAAYPRTQVIVSDDGLQHHALARDVEICVFDARGVGNGWLLPAGPLREPWPRPVDLVVCGVVAGGHAFPPYEQPMHEDDRSANPAGSARVPTTPQAHTARRRLADHAVRADGTRIALAELRARPVHAVAAIAQPDAFFAMLRAAGIHLAQATALPDHGDFEGFAAGDAPLVCTEKDAAKLWRRQPGAWAVPLVLDIDAPFWAALDRRVDAKLSSADGSPPP
jgi:tetraacyldisaccharide 4'-kinase